MKMRRTMVLLLALLLAGCSSANSSSEPDNNSVESVPSETVTEKIGEEIPEEIIADNVNETVAVFDRDGKKLGEISRYGLASMTDEGIFYRAFPKDQTENSKSYEFRLFDPKSGKDCLIGTVNDLDYEVGYDRTELNSCIYELLISGDLMNDEPEVQHLYKFDLKNGTAEDVHSVEGTVGPYTTMTEFGGKILICESLKNRQDGSWTNDIIEYDPESGSSRKIMSFELLSNTGSDTGLRGDTMRHIASDGEHLYILRVSFTDSGARLMLDTYDRSYNRLSEQDVSGFIVQSCELNGMVQEDFDNELRQYVSNMEIVDGRYIYYENFSCIRFFGDLSTGKLISEDTNGNFSVSLGSGRPFWYLMGDGGVKLGDEPRKSIFEFEDGSLTEQKFEDKSDGRYEIWLASVSPNGTRMLELSYKSPNDSSETLPVKMCIM